MKRLIIALLLLFAFFSSCEKDDSTEKENINTDYVISIDEEFDFELVANHTTGYRWQWANSQTVKIVDSIEYYYIADNPNLPGSPGKEIWTFKGVKKGLDSLLMEYSRPTVPNSVADSKTIVVKVE